MRYYYLEFLRLMMSWLWGLFIPYRFISLKHLSMLQNSFVASKILSSLKPYLALVFSIVET
jgi:hypothetical protein